jgi:Flp pilus assembly protein TadD
MLRYRQAVAVEPKSASAHVAFAKFLLRNDNDRAAMFHLAEANRLNPKDKWVAEQLAMHGLPPETKLASH